jgi:hypothetical protein
MSEAKRLQIMEARRQEKADFVEQSFMRTTAEMNFAAKPAQVPQQIAGSKPKPALGCVLFS